MKNDFGSNFSWDEISMMDDTEAIRELRRMRKKSLAQCKVSAMKQPESRQTFRVTRRSNSMVSLRLG